MIIVRDFDKVRAMNTKTLTLLTLLIATSSLAQTKSLKYVNCETPATRATLKALSADESIEVLGHGVVNPQTQEVIFTSYERKNSNYRLIKLIPNTNQYYVSTANCQYGANSGVLAIGPSEATIFSLSSSNNQWRLNSSKQIAPRKIMKAEFDRLNQIVN